MMSTDIKKGFTLLELLIVLAVIGLLASIMLVSFSQAQRRARIAQGWQFSDSLRASLQADMVAWWPFDETSGSVAKDNYFNQLNGTVYGATWVQGIVNNALSFDGIDDYVRISGTSVFQRADGQALTVEVWIKPSRLAGTYQDIVANRSVAAYNWILYQHATDGSVQLHGIQQYKSTYIPPLGTWTHIAVTVSGNRVSTLYANGKVVQTVTDYNYQTQTPNELSIGNFGSYEHYQGLIDEVRIYGAALPQSAIQQHYAEGLKTHQNLVKK